LRLPAYSASAKVICFIEKLGDWCPEILPNQEVFFRISLASILRKFLPSRGNALEFLKRKASAVYLLLCRL